MERATAIKKLTKILGKSLGYRVDPKAPDQDERDEARAELRISLSLREASDKNMKARAEKILQADTEYQRLKTEHAEQAKYCEELSATMRHYRFTVGIHTAMFFAIKAQGDSWEQVIAKLTAERQSA